MREKRLPISKILKELDKYEYLKIPSICIDCMLEVEHDVLEIYTNVTFKVIQIEDNLYSLTIIL